MPTLFHKDAFLKIFGQDSTSRGIPKQIYYAYTFYFINIANTDKVSHKLSSYFPVSVPVIKDMLLKFPRLKHKILLLCSLGNRQFGNGLMRQKQHHFTILLNVFIPFASVPLAVVES